MVLDKEDRDFLNFLCDRIGLSGFHHSLETPACKLVEGLENYIRDLKEEINKYIKEVKELKDGIKKQI